MTSTPHRVPLSVGQEAMKVAWQLDPQTWTNIIPFPLAVRGRLDPVRLSAAVDALGAAFPHLRGRVTYGPEGNCLDWSDAPPIPFTETTTETGRDEAVRHAWQVPFDLRIGPLARVEVITGQDWQVLLLCVHHLVSDGASMLLVLEALRQAYSGEPVTVAHDPHVLEAHALRSARLSQTPEGERHRAHWTAELGSDAPGLQLPAAPETPPRYSMVSDLLPADLVAGLHKRAEALGVSYVTALMAGYYALLRRHSGASDVLSFVPYHGRTLPETRQQVGYFVNLLPIRARMSGSDTYADLMQQLRGRVKSALTHGDLPQPAIMRCAGLVGPQARELTHRSLFQYWDASLRDGLDVMALRLVAPGSQAVLSLLDIESTAGFTLAVMVRQDSAGTHVLWKDPAGALGESVLAKLAADYHEVLWTIADDPDTPLIEMIETPDALPATTTTTTAAASAGGTLDTAALTAMTEVWQDVLGIDGIDPQDSFFELGGHSLLAESLVIDVSRRFGRNVELRALFTWPRLVEFTEHVVELQA